MYYIWGTSKDSKIKLNWILSYLKHCDSTINLRIQDPRLAIPLSNMAGGDIHPPFYRSGCKLPKLNG